MGVFLCLRLTFLYLFYVNMSKRIVKKKKRWSLVKDQPTGTQKHDSETGATKMNVFTWKQTGSKPGGQSTGQTSPERGRRRIGGQGRKPGSEQGGQEYPLITLESLAWDSLAEGKWGDLMRTINMMNWEFVTSLGDISLQFSPFPFKKKSIYCYILVLSSFIVQHFVLHPFVWQILYK